MASGQLIQTIVFSLYTIHRKDPQGSVPIIDREVPTSTAEALILTSTLNRDIGNGEHAVIHYRAGVGRAGMIASAVLVQTGYTPGTAYSTDTSNRGSLNGSRTEVVTYVFEQPGEVQIPDIEISCRQPSAPARTVSYPETCARLTAPT